MGILVVGDVGTPDEIGVSTCLLQLHLRLASSSRLWSFRILDHLVILQQWPFCISTFSFSAHAIGAEHEFVELLLQAHVNLEEALLSQGLSLSVIGE